MKSDWLNLEGQDADFQTVASRLNDSPYDELVEIDLANDRCRNLYHVEGKYFVPVKDGRWSEMYAYGMDHMVHPADRKIFSDMMDPATISQRLERAEIPGVLSAELRYRTMDGHWLWIRQVLVSGQHNGLPEGVANCYIYDIDVQKRREQGRAAASPSQAASFRRDDLTGLLLDQEFFALAQQMLPMLSGQWCVVAVDIENFKLFCDWHGQQTGHFLLAEIGEILQRVERENNGLAGYRGQDDFSLLMPYDMQRIKDLYEELRALIVSQGDSVGFQPTFGICMIEGSEDQVMELYNHAALTAEQIKGDFRNRIRVYDPAIQLKTAEEYEILSRFQRSLDSGEVFFYLQPQCRVSTGHVVGAESLARWRTADGTMISPARFVPILEKYGMVTNLDKFIWEGVCAWLRKWMDEGHTPVPISVNVSQIDIFTIDVPDYFNKLLQKYRLPPYLLKVEITESAYVEDTDVVRETVRRLRNLGMLALMDDFGSGYSSLNMLRSLNVDVIKLDAQFLRISENEVRKGINILESIVNMAKTMTLPIIVEGVETQEQISFLSDLGCRYIQGFYFYRPMPVEEFEDLIRDEKRIDLKGLEVKANDQFHTREFLDESVFTDAMLNNILGPVAVYRWSGDNVDVIRFNQQYYQMVDIELDELNERRRAIQRFFYPEDVEKLYLLLERAALDRLNGASGVLRVYKPNGVLSWISLKLYFIEDNDQGMLFYGSSKDVTELQYVNAELPGGYHRCAVDGDYEFYYISQGFQDMVGYTAAEIREKFDNKFANLVHRDDLPILRVRTEAALRGETVPAKPYRLKCKDGGHIYVVNQTRMTDQFGQLSFQSVAIDVTDMVKLRNRMRLLSKFVTDDVVFVRRKGDGWKFKVVIHGLEAKLGLTGKELERLLNSGELFGMLAPGEADGLRALAESAMAQSASFEFDITLRLPGNRALPLRMKNDPVTDKTTKVEYICVLRER